MFDLRGLMGPSLEKATCTFVLHKAKFSFAFWSEFQIVSASDQRIWVWVRQWVSCKSTDYDLTVTHWCRLCCLHEITRVEIVGNSHKGSCTNGKNEWWSICFIVVETDDGILVKCELFNFFLDDWWLIRLELRDSNQSISVNGMIPFEWVHFCQSLFIV